MYRAPLISLVITGHACDDVGACTSSEPRVSLRKSSFLYRFCPQIGFNSNTEIRIKSPVHHLHPLGFPSHVSPHFQSSFGTTNKVSQPRELVAAGPPHTSKPVLKPFC